MINKLILGTVQLGLEYGINNQKGKPSTQEAFKILHSAYDNGIRILDTAEAYGNSQEIIGEFQKLNPNKNFKIITKLNAQKNINNNLLDNIKSNCEQLNSNSLYAYMFHNYTSFISNKYLLKDLVKAKGLGLVNKIGISLYTNQEVSDIVKNYEGFDFIQIPFNLLDNKTKRYNSIQLAKTKGIEVLTRSVFLQGLFFMQSNQLPKKLKPLKDELEIIKKLSFEYKLSIESLALKYVLEKDYIAQVLIGVDNVEQLNANINISNSEQSIPHDLIDQIDVSNSNLLNPSLW